MSWLGKIRSAAAGALAGASMGWGGPYGETTRFSTDRGRILYYLPSDSRDYLDGWTRKEIMRKVEWLLQTFACVKEGLRGVARQSVGDSGICLQMTTDDDEWNDLAERDFETYALSPDRFDRAGRRNFYEAQEFAVYSRIKAGEFCASHAGNPRWLDGDRLLPCVQVWDPLDIESPENQIDNKSILDGVRVGEATDALGYFVRAGDGKHREIPASEFIHWFFPEHASDVRAVSELAQAVNPLVDAKELMAITTKTAKQNTALGMHIKRMVKASGGGALDRIRTLSGAATTGPTTNADGTVDPKFEKLTGGGGIIYTDENGDVKFLTPNSPTPLLEPFITKVLMRNALSSLGPPSEFFWALQELNGVAQRVVLVKADQVTRKLGSDLVVRFCNPVATRYLLHRINTGKLREPRDPNWLLKMEWQLPGRISIDNGRDAAAEINQLSNGIETLQGINDRRGRRWRKQITQWFAEFKFAKATAERLGVEWAMPYWRASLPGAAGGPQEPPDDDETPKPKKKED